MPVLHEADPIWGEMPAEVYDWDYGGRRVRSDRAGGSFEVGSSNLHTVGQLSPIDKAKLTSWILERNRFGAEEWPRITKEVIDDIRRRRPLTTAARIDRLLEYLSAERYRPGDRPTWLEVHQVSPQSARARHQAMAWTQCASEAELSAMRQLVMGEGYFADANGHTIISAKGFARMEELESGGAPTDQVFVAMWFSPDTADAYSEGIAPAVTDAGYRPLRIDQKEHSNKIDDEIIAEIRRSSFVIADFTCDAIEVDGARISISRGGVYYEAGFAQGLGIPVIWSVRADQIETVHFDTRQYNHITWVTPDELKTKLINRIGAMFGHRADALTPRQ